VLLIYASRFHFITLHCGGTGVRGLTRGLATLPPPRCIHKDNDGRTLWQCTPVCRVNLLLGDLLGVSIRLILLRLPQQTLLQHLWPGRARIIVAQGQDLSNIFPSHAPHSLTCLNREKEVHTLHYITSDIFRVCRGKTLDHAHVSALGMEWRHNFYLRAGLYERIYNI